MTLSLQIALTALIVSLSLMVMLKVNAKHPYLSYMMAGLLFIVLILSFGTMVGAALTAVWV